MNDELIHFKIETIENALKEKDRTTLKALDAINLSMTKIEDHILRVEKSAAKHEYQCPINEEYISQMMDTKIREAPINAVNKWGKFIDNLWKIILALSIFGYVVFHVIDKYK